MSTQYYPSNVEVHRWAETQPWGHKVGKGMSRQLVLAWNKAHPDRPYVKSQAYHGTTGGYTNHNCRCRLCTDAAVAAAEGYAEGRRASS